MKTKGLRSRRQLKLSIYGTLFILLTVPLAVFYILKNTNFDPTSNAGIESFEPICRLEFPYINSQSVEKDTLTQVDVQISKEGKTCAECETEKLQINSLSVSSTSNGLITQKTYTKEEAAADTTIIEKVYYKANRLGADNLVAKIEYQGADGLPRTADCKMVTAATTTENIIVAPINNAPKFTSDPSSATPSNVIKKGVSYTYKLTAADTDLDKISYSYSFTPQADWMNVSVIKDGTGGQLELKFQGVPDKSASYIANVFIHDGYNQHLSSQSWVISVEQGENDVPKVTVTQPTAGTKIMQGSNVNIAWSATDLNQIIKYKLYYSTDPGNIDKWNVIDANISYKVGTYILNTATVTPGIYVAIVQAVDNQDPPATGTGVSATFEVQKPPDPVVTPPDGQPVEPQEPEPDDGLLPLPQITATIPESGAKLKNRRPTIGATLIAGKDATVNKETIKLLVDGKDQTKSIELVDISDSEVKILYKPKEDLKIGKHSVQIVFEDSNSDKGQSKWIFEIVEQADSDVYKILGFEIPKKWVIWGIIILVVLLAALSVPWLLYLAWKNSDDDDYQVYPAPKADPATPVYNQFDSSTYKKNSFESNDTFTSPVYEASTTEVKSDEPQFVTKSDDSPYYFNSGIGVVPVQPTPTTEKSVDPTFSGVTEIKPEEVAPMYTTANSYSSIPSETINAPKPASGRVQSDIVAQDTVAQPEPMVTPPSFADTQPVESAYVEPTQPPLPADNYQPSDIGIAITEKQSEPLQPAEPTYPTELGAIGTTTTLNQTAYQQPAQMEPTQSLQESTMQNNASQSQPNVETPVEAKPTGGIDELAQAIEEYKKDPTTDAYNPYSFLSNQPANDSTNTPPAQTQPNTPTSQPQA